MTILIKRKSFLCRKLRYHLKSHVNFRNRRKFRLVQKEILLIENGKIFSSRFCKASCEILGCHTGSCKSPRKMCLKLFKTFKQFSKVFKSFQQLLEFFEQLLEFFQQLLKLFKQLLNSAVIFVGIC